MKKTLIAAAVAASFAAPAMADVSVSGQVKLTVYENDSVDYAPFFDNSLTFKASEDLGNGLSAFAQITLDTDGDESASGSMKTKDQVVGIKGGFGTVKLGRMETLVEGVTSAGFDDGRAKHSGTNNAESALTAISRVNAVAYVSPTVNGFHVAAAGVLDGADNGMTAAMDYLLAYDNGPLAVKVGLTKPEDDDDITSASAFYTMGDAKFGIGYFEEDSITDMIYRLDYKMGNNSLLVEHKASDLTNGDVTSVKITHAMSKRTKVWFGDRMVDSAVASGDTLHAGIIHKF